MPIYRHTPPPPVIEAWPDHLSRRLYPSSNRAETLSIADDGRIAIGLSCTVTVLTPSLISRLVPLQMETRVEHMPLEYALLDTDARVAQGIRAPAVGHQVAFEPEYTKPGGVRRDTTLYNGEISFLAWATSAAGAVLFVINGEGNCFATVPRYAGEGTWGGVFATWQYRRVFPDAVGNTRPAPKGKTQRKEAEERKDDSNAVEGDWGLVQEESGLSGLRRPPTSGRTVSKEKKGHIPQNQVRCVSLTRVFRGPEGHPSEQAGTSEFVILGRKDGTFVFSFGGWERADGEQGPVLSLHSGWSASLACLEDVEYGGKSMTLVAVGGAFGELMVYGLWFEEFSGGLSILTSKALWKSEPSLLFGTVSSLSWSPCLSYGQLRLAVASGNAVTVLDWTNVLPETTGFNPWAIPDVHQIADAHDGLVSSVAVVVDNSFLSSSLDGKICRWVVEQWDQGEAKEPLHVVHCGILHSGPPSEPIMAMQRTPLGFGVAAMTTVTRFGIEVNDHNEDAKRKYCAGARRSLLSMYIKPALEGTSEAAQQILGSVEARATTRRFVGEAIVMWEVELFLQQLQGAHASIVLAALRQRFRNMLGHLRGRSIPNLSQERFYHYVRVIACLSRVIIRVSGAGEDDGGLMTLQHGEISKNVRCIHYDSCMASFLQSKTPVNALSLDEIRALESMCHYVAKCDHELFWDAAATLERIRLVRAALSPRKASMPLPCIVCGPDSDVALKSDAQNPNVFRCSMNDCFERCVLTALPCTDVVPRVCYACDSKALVKDFDPFEERGKEFQWISNVGRCPICLCVLVPSSVEAH